MEIDSVYREQRNPFERAYVGGWDSIAFAMGGAGGGTKQYWIKYDPMPVCAMNGLNE